MSAQFEKELLYTEAQSQAIYYSAQEIIKT